MNIGIGEYVRTYKGIIAKVEAYQEFRTFANNDVGVSFYSFDTDKGSIAECDIKNHNENIIELLEEGDIVNGHRVYQINLKETLWTKIDGDLFKICDAENIKIILTKEKHEQKAYKMN